MKKYFLSFVEEMVLNPNYQGYVGGRIEVYVENQEYAVEEIRFFTKKIEKFYRFRKKWDFKVVSLKKLNTIRKTARKRFNEF